MKRDLNTVSKEKFDVAIIGGGVIGTGVARDAALRGLRTLLLEKDDFGYGTTSRSTRLIHGGLRYLSHLDFKLVRLDLKEREVLLRIASHLVKPLSFLLPLTGVSQRLVMGTGMKLYDMLSYDKSVPGYKYLSHQQTISVEPQLEMKGFKGAYQFYDCQIAYPERLCIENAISAAENGAVVMNHAEVVGINTHDRTIQGLKFKDRLSSQGVEIECSMIVNVTGHWSNNILNMAFANPANNIRTTKGIHLVTRKLTENALILFSKSDGRLLFIIPWEHYSLIGTTDTEYSGDKDVVTADEVDINYIVSEVKRSFPAFDRQDIFYTMAGLRTLVSSKNSKVSNISRSHRLVDHEASEGIKGLVSVLGGKMTGYRSIAEEAIDIVCQRLGVSANCITHNTPLPGAPGYSDEILDQMVVETNLPRDLLDHLNSIYGSRLNRVLEIAKTDSRGYEKVCPHSKDILAQVWYSVTEESSLTVSDYLLRRGTAGLASCQGLDAVEVVAVEMGRLLGWSIGEWQQQVAAYREDVAPGNLSRK